MNRATATALLVVLAACSGDGSAPEAVERDPDFVIGTPTAPYRVVYDVDGTGTESVSVRPPFESRVETSTGAVQVTAMDRISFRNDGDALVVAREPGLAPPDVRVAAVLDDAEAAGLLERRGQKEILDRRCQVVRTGAPLAAGPLVPITDDEHVDTCIDADGIPLEEVVTSDGARVLRRVATDVDLDVDLGDDRFDPGDITLPADEGGGAALRVDPERGDVGPFWVLPGNEPPDGFVRVGRRSIIPPQPERFADDSPRTVAGTADVFRRGSDALVVWQGGTIGRADAYAPVGGARTVDGGALGAGEVVLSALGTELRFPQPGGRFVHVIGTLPPDDLLEVARSLLETEGTGLVYLDR